MTFDEFDKFAEQLMAEVRKMRDTKGKEYCRNEDRFDNFNRQAAELNLSRETIWLVYYTKHWDAIRSYLKNGREFSTEGIRSRIVDAITYLTLLAGMLDEKKDSRQMSLPSAADLDAHEEQFKDSHSYHYSPLDHCVGCGHSMHDKGKCYRMQCYCIVGPVR